jgi:TonB family protein
MPRRSLVPILALSLATLAIPSVARAQGDPMPNAVPVRRPGPPPAYFEFQVDRPAHPLSGQPAPTYPDELRAAGMPGRVLAQFLVDTAGRADSTTFRVLRTSHALFSAAVRRAVLATRFAPAELNGRRVPQLVQQMFDFPSGR